MKLVIAVDANPIISALIGGFAREVLFFHNFEFITTEYTLLEVKKYILYICKKTGVSEDLLKILLQRLPVKTYSLEKYIEKARNNRTYHSCFLIHKNKQRFIFGTKM